jgi:hypothetical protein
MKNSGRLRKPHKIASRFAMEGGRHARTLDELEEGPETLGVPATFWFFLVAQKEQINECLAKPDFVVRDTKSQQLTANSQ